MGGSLTTFYQRGVGFCATFPFGWECCQRGPWPKREGHTRFRRVYESAEGCCRLTIGQDIGFWEVSERFPDRLGFWLDCCVGDRGGMESADEEGAVEHARRVTSACSDGSKYSQSERSLKAKFQQFAVCIVPPPRPHLLSAMSFAGRRRGNKVKKGVQFTLMVVGTSLCLDTCTFSPPILLQLVIYLIILRYFRNRSHYLRQHPLRVRSPCPQGL